MNISENDLLVDVRTKTEFDICKLPMESVNYPLKDLKRSTESFIEQYLKHETKRIIFICRRGNDSQRAADLIQKIVFDRAGVNITDLRGGLTAWHNEVDCNFPLY